MSNSIGQLSAPSVPAGLCGQQITDFMATGNVSPTRATPTFRTGSGTTYAQSSLPATALIPLSSSIVVGDLIIMTMQTNTTASPTSLPPGFNFWGWINAAGNNYMWLWWRIAQAGDAGSTVSWTSGMTGYAVAFAVCSYSGVNPAMPGYMLTNSSSSATSWNAPVIQAPYACTVVECFGVTAGTGVVLTGPSTSRVNASITTVATCICDQSLGAAGPTGTQTATSTIGGTFNAFTIILCGNPSGGAVPPGGWTLYDVFCNVSSNTQYIVYQSAGASNNAGANWYLVMGVTWGGYQYTTYINFFLCELYNNVTHQWNACAFWPTTSAPPTGYAALSGSTVPPWALVYGTPNNVGATRTYQAFVTAQISAGTTNFLVAANRDGFFFSANSAGNIIFATYVGTGTTLVTNPNAPDTVPLFFVDLTVANGYANCGTTREPGITAWNQYYMNYNTTYFLPTTPNGTPVGTIMGTVNSTPGDLFLSGGLQPIATRFLVHRVSTFGGGVQNGGAIRAVLPAWLQWAWQSGCAWGDTTIEGSDTLTFMGGAPSASYCWLDTSAA